MLYKGAREFSAWMWKPLSVQHMTAFPTLPGFLRTLKEFISEAVSFHVHNLILIIFIHITLSFSFASLTVALKFKWSNIDEVPSSGTDHILIHHIQLLVVFFSILCIFHQFLSMLWSITFPYAREKCKIAENKCPELPQSAAPEVGGLF